MFFLSTSQLWSQITTSLFTPGNEVVITGFPNTACGTSPAVSTCTNCTFAGNLDILNQHVQSGLQNTAMTDRITVEWGKPYDFELVYKTTNIFSNVLVLDYDEVAEVQYRDIYSNVDGIAPVARNERLTLDRRDAQLNPIFSGSVTFSKGTKDGYLLIPFQEGLRNAQTGTFTFHESTIVIPFIVEGPIDFSQQIDFIDTISEPQIPYLVLHAPPGDGSSSSFQSNKTTCRNFTTNVAESNSNSANLAVKIGVAGSAGLFVTTNFEFSVTMSAGLSVGDMSIVTSDNQTCVTVGQGFSTQSLTGPDGGGDVFVGYGTDLALGLYDVFKVNESTCLPEISKGLAYTPVGNPRQFVYTKEAIELDIANLEQTVKDSTAVGARRANNAQNQIDVWNQVLAMNTANINNPNNQVLASNTFSNNSPSTHETGITIVETNTIAYEHFIEGNVGVSAVIEVGGSGVSGGYEYKASKKFGATQNQSGQDDKLLKYTLADDDAGDIFYLRVERDPMYGTPIFKQEANTTSSCPYQGGYQRDQPYLTFVDNSQRIDLTGIPNGTQQPFQIKICNDSNQDRTYHLKGNAGTNLQGLIVEGFGNNVFSTNDDGIEFQNVPAGGCLTATLTLKQSNLATQDYENVELFLYPLCEGSTGSIKSSIFMDVSFTGTVSSTDLASQQRSMNVFPNPTTGDFTVQLIGAQQAGRLMLKDLTGKVIAQQNVQAGASSIEMNQEKLVSGMYLLVFESNAFSLTQKLVVQK